MYLGFVFLGFICIPERKADWKDPSNSRGKKKKTCSEPLLRNFSNEHIDFLKWKIKEINDWNKREKPVELDLGIMTAI